MAERPTGPAESRPPADAAGPTLFALTAEHRAADVLATLRSVFEVHDGGERDLDRTLVDTFDARLGRAGGELWLDHAGPRAALRWRRGRLRTPPVPLPNGAVPAFAAELPAGRVRDEVGPLAAPRRLLPTVRLVGRRREFAVLDAVGKTVARVVLDDRLAHAPGRREGQRLPRVLRVEPVRGYDTHRRVVRLLTEELGLATVEDGELAAALRCVGREPGRDPCTPRPGLERGLPAEEAMRAVLKELLRIVRLNEDHVDDDRDTEFLHDFRVAVRQTRSVLGQLRDVLPEEAVEHHKREFRWLGRVTGPARDLDVFVDDWHAMLADLGPELEADLEPARALLLRERAAARKQLARDLRSARYRRLVEGWARALTVPVTDGPERADAPIAKVAGRAIERAWKRVLRKGRRLGDDTAPETFHDLRIAAKKLRYLIALFGGVFDRERRREAVAVLKRLQNRLGEANDALTQSERMRAVAETLRLDSGTSTATLLAAGRLIERLEVRGALLRSASREAFATFAQRSHRELFSGLFGRAGRR